MTQSSEERSGGSSARIGPTILVVDDDDIFREVVVDVLQGDGFHAVPVESAASALRKLRSGEPPPDLILLDHMMPGMTGLQFREEQLRDPSLASIPVVLMTASTVELAGAAIEEVLYKPFDPRRLIAAVERHAALRDTDRIFVRGSEMGDLMRSIDWSETPVGPVETWSASLRMVVEILLRNPFPMLVWWGSEFVQFYNDGYRPIAGDKHPRSMGQTGSECWAEIWDLIGPMAEGCLTRGESITDDDLCVLIHRRGFLEETHFKFAYNAVPDPTVLPTGIGGVLATVAETTEQVYAERQLRTLRELGAHAAEAKTAEEACTAAAAVLAGNDWDVPFALLYLLDTEGEPRLAASVGFDGDRTPSWPLDGALLGDSEVLDDLKTRFGVLPSGRWSEPPHRAIVLPLGEAHPDGVLVCGVSPHRALDEGYRGFFELAAAQIVAAIRNARAHQEEHKRVEALAAIDRAKTAFFSNVSHEFRTPLTLMLGPTKDLLSGAHGPLAEGQRVQLELLHRNGLRLQRLVNSLLDFSRVEAGRIQASYEPLDLAVLTRDIASAFRAAIEGAGLAFDVQCETLSAPVYVDRDMWEKIVLNLVSNAFKFTFEGAIEVRLADANGNAVLTVKDTGTGIAEHEMPRLFERFHRIENARARTHEGSGIGLALVQELAKLHGGSVRAESRVREGSVFTVTIPKGTAHLPSERVLAARTMASTVLGAAPFVEEALRWQSHVDEEAVWSTPPSSGRILVADDNADMRDYVRRILERYWTVETVNDGAAALAAARARPPDLVLTDVMMPRIDGFELLRKLRSNEHTRHIPVVVLSARVDEEARLEGLHAGAEDYLTKPFSARELRARVRTHVELARLRARIKADRERLYDLFMQAPAPICVLRGEDLVFEMANEFYYKVAGRRNVVGRPLLDALPELRGQGCDELLLGVLRTGKAITGKEMRLELDRSGDGNLEETYWTFTYAPLKNADGEVDCVMALCNEITEQVHAHKRVSKSEEKFRGLVAQVGAGIAQTDCDGRFTLVNDRYCEIVGRSREELMQLRMHDITHPDDLRGNAVQFDELVATRTPFVIEKRYVRPDGSFVWVENSVSRIDDVRGRPQGVAAVSIDITQRKQDELALRESRERFRWIFESAEVSIWEEDFSRVKPRLDELKREHGAGLRAFLEANPALVVELGSLMQIRDVNPATLTMFGAADKETLYSSLDAISLPETIGVFLDELMAIAEDKRRFSSEAALRTLDGKPLHVLCTTTYPDADGSYENALVTLTDISMRKLAEQEREARVAEMERAVRFSERFVGILGHDLRNPLNAIATSVTLLSPHSEPDKFARTVRSIVRTAARMDRMIAQLLDFTRIRLGGGLPLLREPVDLLEVTRQVTEELESAVHLEIPVSTIGDVTGTWDRDRLSQLVSNLAANAIEHGVRGTVEILIDGTDRSAVQLEVSNGGVIAVEKLPGLFDPLRNAGDRKKNSMSSRGLGLGLYITKEITVAHGGSIHVDSAEPHGTRVVVELPRIEGAQTERVFA